VSVNAQGSRGRPLRRMSCDVEVDPETGQCLPSCAYTGPRRIVGRAIHPSYVEGQIPGRCNPRASAGHSMRNTSTTSRAASRTPGFSTTAVRSAFRQLPMIDPRDRRGSRTRAHPFSGVRGVGEVPIVPPMAAVANANPWPPIGTRLARATLPMSPPKIPRRDRRRRGAQAPRRRNKGLAVVVQARWECGTQTAVTGRSATGRNRDIEPNRHACNVSAVMDVQPGRFPSRNSSPAGQHGRPLSAQAKACSGVGGFESRHGQRSGLGQA